MIPHRVKSEDQKEVLKLLCKVHELEIQNTEVQSSCIIRDFQIKKKDMVISRYRQHQHLSDQIIRKQKRLIEGITILSFILNTYINQLFKQILYSPSRSEWKSPDSLKQNISMTYNLYSTVYIEHCLYAKK
jgi:trehalose utilization protein